MPLLAANPTDRVEQLILLTDKLSDIITAEVKILEERRPKDLSPLSAEKAKLSSVYAQELRAIAQDRSLIGGVAPDLAERLKAVTKTFQTKVDKEMRLLTRARRITEGAVKAIAEDAASRNRPPTGYGPTPGARAKRPAAAVTPITLNEVA